MQSLNRLKSERPRRKFDFYETPYGLCKTSLFKMAQDEAIELGKPFKLYDVLDPGSGSGIWGTALKHFYSSDTVAPNITGIDIQYFLPNGSYDFWFVNSNFLDEPWSSLPDSDLFDLVIGNPPYGLAEEFVRQSLNVLCEGGRCFFLLRLAFLESKKRHLGLFTDFQPKRVYVLSRRPSFFSSSEDGKKTTDAMAYAMFLWQKGWEGKTELDWLYWEYNK